MWILTRIYEYSKEGRLVPEPETPMMIKLLDVNYIWTQPMCTATSNSEFGFILLAMGLQPDEIGCVNTIAPAMTEEESMIVLREILAGSSTGADLTAILERCAPDALAAYASGVAYRSPLPID